MCLCTLLVYTSTRATIAATVHVTRFAYVCARSWCMRAHTPPVQPPCTRLTSHLCTQLVYASTGAAYGSPVEVPVTEDSLAHATTPYARAALAAESAIRDAAAADPALNVAILRTFNVIGGDPEGALGEWPGPDVHRKVSRLSPACIDAAMLVTPHLEITGTRRRCLRAPVWLPVSVWTLTCAARCHASALRAWILPYLLRRTLRSQVRTQLTLGHDYPPLDPDYLHSYFHKLHQIVSTHCTRFYT